VQARRYAAMGVTFIGVGGDIGLLVNAAAKLLADLRGA
jgi:2-keto-3-deoxy-L-rhamnonate aldolase RhmA